MSANEIKNLDTDRRVLASGPEYAAQSHSVSRRPFHILSIGMCHSDGWNQVRLYSRGKMDRVPAVLALPLHVDAGAYPNPQPSLK